MHFIETKETKGGFVKSMYFSIIIPIFQTPAILKMFLDSLSKSLEYDVQIIFINDGSGEIITAMLEDFSLTYSSNYDIIIINHPFSYGCAKSINEALTKVSPKCEAVIFMDSDLILTSPWQKKISQDFIENSDIGVIGCTLIYPQTDGVQCCGITYQDKVGRHLHLNAKLEMIHVKPLQKVQCTIFAFCAIRFSAIKETGLLNEEFYNGYEDWDYQFRVKKLGYSIVIDTEIIHYHWEKSNGSHRNFNRKGNLGRFWSIHGADVFDDLGEYIKKEFDTIPYEKQAGYILIDLCEARTEAVHIRCYLEDTIRLKIVEYMDLSILCKDSGSIWLPEIVNSTVHMKHNTFIFLCDQFVRLLDNNYWWSLRKNYNNNDIIVDLNGNVINFSNLANTFWPGTKIR